MTSIFHLKEFSIDQNDSVFKVGIDSILLGAWIKVKSPETILDVGTGTGLLALMVGQKYESSKITAVELNPVSYELALENVKASPYRDRIEVFNSRFQDFAQNSDLKFDLIISNPPYYSDGPKPGSISKTMSRHTIHLTHEELLIGIKELLNQSGKFYTILPVIEGQNFIEIANKFGLRINKICKVKPGINKNFNRLMLEFSKQNSTEKFEEITIRDSKGFYTSKFKELTSDFYLNLGDFVFSS